MSTPETIPVPTAPQAAPAKKKAVWRSIVAVICFVIAAVLTLPAIIGYWGQRTLTDAERYAATMAPMAEDPAIINELSAEINQSLIAELDVQGLVKEWLPEQAQPLVGPISGAVNSFIEKEVDAFLRSERFQELWTDINVLVQKSLIAALSGNPDGAVQIQGDEVVLDTGILIAEVQARLVDRGLTVLKDVQPPEAADRQIVLLQSEELAKARVLYAFSVPIARWLIAIVLLLFLAAILLAHRRSRMVMWVGAAIFVNTLLLRVALGLGDKAVSSSMPDPEAADAGSAFFTHLTTYLMTAAKFGLALGVLMIFFGWLFGRSRGAVATRSAMNRAIGGAGSHVSADSPLAGVGTWVAGKRTILIGLVIALAGIVLFLQDPLTAGVLILLTLVVVVAVVIILILAAAAPGPQDVAVEPEPVTAAAAPGSGPDPTA